MQAAGILPDTQALPADRPEPPATEHNTVRADSRGSVPDTPGLQARRFRIRMPRQRDSVFRTGYKEPQQKAGTSADYTRRCRSGTCTAEYTAEQQVHSADSYTACFRDTCSHRSPDPYPAASVDYHRTENPFG